MTDRVRTDPLRPVRRAYDSIVADVRRNNGRRAIQLQEFHSVRSSLSRVKRNEVPSLPSTIDDVAITGVWSETWSSERFLLYEDNAWGGVAVFATDENIEILHLT